MVVGLNMLSSGSLVYTVHTEEFDRDIIRIISGDDYYFAMYIYCTVRMDWSLATSQPVLS